LWLCPLCACDAPQGKFCDDNVSTIGNTNAQRSSSSTGSSSSSSVSSSSTFTVNKPVQTIAIASVGTATGGKIVNTSVSNASSISSSRSAVDVEAAAGSRTPETMIAMTPPPVAIGEGSAVAVPHVEVAAANQSSTCTTNNNDNNDNNDNNSSSNYYSDAARGKVAEEEKEEGYCICGRDSTALGRMVGCENAKCFVGWFHLECVGLLTEPDGVWLCPLCRAQQGDVGLVPPAHGDTSSNGGDGGSSGSSSSTTGLYFKEPLSLTRRELSMDAIGPRTNRGTGAVRTESSSSIAKANRKYQPIRGKRPAASASASASETSKRVKITANGALLQKDTSGAGCDDRIDPVEKKPCKLAQPK